MNSLPDDPTDNVALSALQSFAHEGTPDGWLGVDALCVEPERLPIPFPPEILVAYVASLFRPVSPLPFLLGWVENHGSVLRDCAGVISLDPHASKAYYRAGLALLALDRADEALDVCARVGDGAANDAGFKALRERAEKMDAARNLIAVPNPDGSANPYAPRFDPEDATGGTPILPAFFLYPEHATSDVVPDFVEDAEFGAVLATMSPPGAPAPPWDADGRYVVGSLVVYAMTRRKRLLKVGRKMTLRDVCRAAGGTSASGTNVQDGLEVKDGCLSFVVVPKGEAEQKWVEEYKSTR
ncbi:hypothetical protein EDB85DRAFT_1893071 [Lactarius pseudohatsudake]|nr:hypothetical protein EDB85DRAFT_1893071 [Lactarius pseudohatsudake]